MNLTEVFEFFIRRQGHAGQFDLRSPEITTGLSVCTGRPSQPKAKAALVGSDQLSCRQMLAEIPIVGRLPWPTNDTGVCADSAFFSVQTTQLSFGTDDAGVCADDADVYLSATEVAVVGPGTQDNITKDGCV
ncbi:hypothetical protein Bbelb_418210 [Branchiostoma belcheri]|nr:hypothetical protein Bbelb_418210 [Branchiostoma belcheri]